MNFESFLDKNQVQKINNSNYLFVGDLHLDTSISSRIDNYDETCLDKLEQVFMIADRNNAIPIFLGDFFNRRKVPYSFYSKVAYILNSYRHLNPHTIIGNHDIIHEKANTAFSYSIGSLITSGLLRPLNNILVQKDGEDIVHIKGCHYGDSPEKTFRFPNIKSLLVAHVFYNQMEPAINSEDVKPLGYDYIVLGHDHQPYETVTVEGTAIYRFGSLLRNSSHQYHADRDVKVLLFNAYEDNFKEIKIDVKPFKDVFSTKAYLEKEQVTKEDLKVKIDAIMQEMTTSNDEDIMNYLPKDTPKPVKKKIKYYLTR